ncbi:MAG: protein-L-isoaspartate O-methyltransferase [Planctomycetota bacterium]|nr:MAG: protein-L-isoaspartate O-methyltransferase [Planctomycetota bacterium]
MSGTAPILDDLAADRRRRQRLIRQLTAALPNLEPRFLAAFEAVPRHHFLPEILRAQAYDNCPLGIGAGQTISQPEVVLHMLALLDPQPGQVVLDLGCGSGWVSALLAQLVGPTGLVVATERHASLLSSARRVLAAYADQERGAMISLALAGSAPGYPDHAPYDRIHVGCCAPGGIPLELLSQLAAPGRMVIPVGQHGGDQRLQLLIKDVDGHNQQQELDPVLFVPLLPGGD